MANTYQILDPSQLTSSAFEAGANIPQDYLKRALANRAAAVEAAYAPQMQQAKIGDLNTLSQFRNSPAGQLRGLSAVGKSYVEPQLLKQYMGQALNNVGYDAPGGKYQQQVEGVMPQLDMNAVNDAYEANRQKLTSDPKTREKVNYAINIDKTLSRINPSVLNYSGPEGYIKLKKDSINAINGNPSKDYIEFEKFAKVQAPLLASQIRQFYGESIQPSVREDLQKLSDPSYFLTNPDVAMARLEEFIDILQNETSTYASSLNAPIRPKEVASPFKKEANKSNVNSNDPLGIR